MTGRHNRDRGIALKACAGLLGILLAAAAAAYAATAARHDHRTSNRALGRVVRDRAPQGSPRRLPRAPRITARPAAVAVSKTAVFSFTAPHRGGFSQCRLDRGPWAACRSPLTYTALVTGRHIFRVRTTVPVLGPGPAARYTWLQAAPKSFTVTPVEPKLETLYPGAAPVQVPLDVKNPNPVPIVITSLKVRVAHDPAGCDSASNLQLTQPNVSNRLPLAVGAGKTVHVPTPTILAPKIQLRNLPVNQDSCQRVTFPLAFSGTAHG